MDHHNRNKVHKTDPQGRKHRRSRTGCLTCRKRKKRCDERKPTCETCERLRLPCQYPSSRSPNENQKFIADMEKIHSVSDDIKREYPQQHLGFLHSHGVHNGSVDRSPDHPITAVESSQLHFPLHYSRMEKDAGPINVDISSPSGAGISDAESTCIIPGTHHMSTRPGFGTKIVPNTPGLTDESTNAKNQDSSPLIYREDIGLPTNDFLSPMLYPTDGSSIPKSDSLALSGGPFTPSLSYEGNHLTALDELSDPFASAAFPHIPRSSSQGTPQSDIYVAARSREASQSPHVLTDNLVFSSNHGTPNGDGHDKIANNNVRPNAPKITEANPNSQSAGITTERFRSIYPDLDANAVSYFEYFRDKQSILMSVSPLNYFRSVFLAFSLRYRAIMYAVLAWAAWHKGDNEELAREYFEHGSKTVRKETINSRSKEEILAALLVLASAKICSGDTSTWRPYLMLAGETIHLHGGLTSFMESESVRWLLKNFAYHEILTSSSLSQPKLFTANDFEVIFNQPSSATLPDTLCACCQPLFVILERINELTQVVRLMRASDDLEKGTEKSAEHIYIAAHDLEQKIWTLQPAHKILQHLSEKDLLLQQTLFDVFKLVAVLHMYQSVLQINSSSISMRVVAHHLANIMDSLFGTTVEGILTFPLFILGISSSTAREREYVVKKFTAMEKRLHARNVTQARVLLARVWEHDQQGRLYVDWNELIDRDGLHFCFC